MIAFLTALWAKLMMVGIEIAVSFVSAIPFSIVWNGLAPTYGKSFIPASLLHISFTHMWGILILIGLVGQLIQILTPKFIHIENQKND